MIQAYQNKLFGKEVGIVFGTFAPLHQGHLEQIMRAKKECDGGCIVIPVGRDGDRGGKEMPIQRRYRYVREFFADDEKVAVYGVNESELGIEPYPKGWVKFLDTVMTIFNNGTENHPIPVFYVGEEEYYNYLYDHGFRVVRLDRSENPISATMIRDNPLKYWDKITYPFRRVFSTNILVIGTASEGKTSLVRDLGKYFNAPYSHEYARDYMEESRLAETELDGADYFAFLDGQYRMNKSLINSAGNNGIFFADSDSMTTKMYAECYSKDPTLPLTESEYKSIAIAADAITARCKWDKIYLLRPHNLFVDDHTRNMAYSGMDERREQYMILKRIVEEAGLWDKVDVLDGNYWENFKYIVDDVKGMIEE